MSTPMPPTSTTPSPPKRTRRRIALIGAAGLVAVLVFVLVYFQPQKLFIDDKVEEAAPEGAVPIVIAEEPAAADSTVEEPMTDDSTMDSTVEEPMTDESMTDDSMAEEVMADEPAAAPAPATFVSLDHGTSGNVLFLEDPTTGERFLRFEGLDTDNGPDLKVYLSTNPVDGPEGDFDDDFVDLGRLQGNQGDQNYLIPEGTDLSRFASVVIWCDRFDSAFGAADLST